MLKNARNDRKKHKAVRSTSLMILSYRLPSFTSADRGPAHSHRHGLAKNNGSNFDKSRMQQTVQQNRKGWKKKKKKN